VASRHLRNPLTWDCDYCQDHPDLKKVRNCDWNQPGECKQCGEIPYEDVETDPQTSKFLCPTCGGRVSFGKAEFLLGKTYRTPGCPKSQITERALFLVKLVDWSEKMGVLPTAQNLFDESFLYFEIRNMVVSERATIEEELSPKEEK